MKKLLLLLYFYSGLIFAQQPVFTKIKNIPLSIKEINCISPENKTTVWAGTNRSLLKIENDSVVGVFEDTLNLQKFSVNCIVPDTTGAKWLGSYISTLTKFKTSTDDAQIFSFYEKINSEYQLITAMLKHENFIFFGTSEGKLFKYDIEFNRFDTIGFPTKAEIYSIFYDQRKTLWVCTNKGLYYSDDFIKWRRVKDLEVAFRIVFKDDIYWVVGKNAQNQTLLIFSDYDRMLIFGWEVSKSRWSRLIVQGIPDNYTKFNDIDFDSKNNIWIALDNGVIRYNPNVDRFDSFMFDQYPTMNIGAITSIKVQTDDVIWVSSINAIMKIELK